MGSSYDHKPIPSGYNCQVYKCDYIPLRLLLRGRSYEASWRAGGDAAPAGRLRQPASGGAPAAVRPHYVGPPELAGRGADEGGRKPAGSGARLGPRPRPEATAPGTEKPRWSAERRAPVATGARASRRGLIRMRRSALRPLA